MLGPGSSSEVNRADRSSTNGGAEPSGSNTWMFNVEDIDPAVVK